jgi:DNA-binding NtrC family response regulator
VDDEPIILNLIAKALEPKYEVLVSKSPRHALELLRTTPPIDLVLSDVEMPEMRGTDLLREVHRISPTTASVMMSGNESVVKETPDGARFLAKPFSLDELQIVVESLLAESRALTSSVAEERQRLNISIQQTRQLRRETRDVRQESGRIRKKLAERLEGHRSQQPAAPSKEPPHD